MTDAVTIQFAYKAGQSHVCPRCYGTGHGTDGWCSISPQEISYQAPSRCPLCEGKGRVLITPVPDEAPPLEQCPGTR